MNVDFGFGLQMESTKSVLKIYWPYDQLLLIWIIGFNANKIAFKACLPSNIAHLQGQGRGYRQEMTLTRYS